MAHMVGRTGRVPIDLDEPTWDDVRVRSLPRKIERKLLDLEIPGVVRGQGKDLMLEHYCYWLAEASTDDDGDLK
jgi:hypothetical protein